MFNENIKSFEWIFEMIGVSLVWTTDFEDELDPDEQWAIIEECMLEAANEVLDMQEGHAKTFLSSNINKLLGSIFVKHMDEWLPCVAIETSDLLHLIRHQVQQNDLDIIISNISS